MTVSGDIGVVVRLLIEETEGVGIGVRWWCMVCSNGGSNKGGVFSGGTVCKVQICAVIIVTRGGVTAVPPPFVLFSRSAV